MMLPPKSGRKAVRLRNASTLSGLSYLYSHLTSLWLSAADGPLQAGDRWPAELRGKFIALAEQIQDLRLRTAMSKWEGSVRGAWAAEEYNRLLEVESDMLSSLVLVRAEVFGFECGVYADGLWRLDGWCSGELGPVPPEVDNALHSRPEPSLRMSP